MHQAGFATSRSPGNVHDYELLARTQALEGEIVVTTSLSTAMRGTLEDDQPPLSRFQPPQVAGRLDIQE
jgi:hypothetical protein